MGHPDLTVPNYMETSIGLIRVNNLEITQLHKEICKCCIAFQTLLTRVLQKLRKYCSQHTDKRVSFVNISL